jgi:hypothetical protein
MMNIRVVKYRNENKEEGKEKKKKAIFDLFMTMRSCAKLGAA